MKNEEELEIIKELLDSFNQTLQGYHKLQKELVDDVLNLRAKVMTLEQKILNQLSEKEINERLEQPPQYFCMICGETKIDGQSYFYKWPDAESNGMDLDGFCCYACCKLGSQKQIDIYLSRLAKQ
jgi:hypothetical protein